MKHRFRRPLSWVILVFIVFLIIILVVPLTQRNNSVSEPSGDECVVDSDCPAYRCPGVRAACISGYCKPVDLKGDVTRCVDLQNPVCGNGICEGSERDGGCPSDCGGQYGLTEERCESAGGNWNECGSPCAGTGAKYCATVCEAHCECGGIAGFTCPDGYTCRLSGQIVDELGVCIPA